MVNLSVSLANLNDEQTKTRQTLLEQFKQEKRLTEEITTFVLTSNEGLADTVKNDKSETNLFWGEGYIHELLQLTHLTKEITFRISPFSFFQTNTHGAEKLFSTAFEMLGDFQGNILDLYCGTGSIGLSLLKMNHETAKADSTLIGIEIVEDAIIDARVNAKINGLAEQSIFIASPAEKALEHYPELVEKICNVGVVVIDPPRE
jgi:tRNA/tmRNA/rRNA uracil-C5-methylase (TrmA/RlmC/RlmD family)